MRSLPGGAIKTGVPMFIADGGPDVFEGIDILLALFRSEGCAKETGGCEEECSNEAQP